MSENVYEGEGLYVTRKAGPAGPKDRRLWQFTIAGDGTYTDLTRDELRVLVMILQQELERE